MTYFSDFSQCTYFDAGASPVISIGWLDGVHEYTQGFVGEHFVERLASLLKDPWQPAVCGGKARCSPCRFIGGPGRVDFAGHTVEVGRNDLFRAHG